MSVESAFTYCPYVVARIVPEPQSEVIWAISAHGRLHGMWLVLCRIDSREDMLCVT
jgi:hypothetical protein